MVPSFFRGRQGELAGPREISKGGRGSAGAGSARGGKGISSSQSVAAQHPGTDLFLDEIYSVLS